MIPATTSGRGLKITELYGQSGRAENERYAEVFLTVTGKKLGTEEWGEYQVSLRLTPAAAREFAALIVGLADTAEKIPNKYSVIRFQSGGTAAASRSKKAETC